MTVEDPDAQRGEMLDRWEQAAVGWGKRADDVRNFGMPVSMWLVEHLGLQPGMRVLELAAGPGDTGFLAAELIAPGGTLICSDGTEAMLDVARSRAERLGIRNVEFRQLNLEWLDLETATVDAALCRWGIMLVLDPAAAAREARRVLRPLGRLAVAVWDGAAHNPWATIPGRAMIAHGLSEPPDPDAPGMFALAGDGVLQELLEEAGFVDVTVETVDIERRYDAAERFIDDTLDMSMMFAAAFRSASEEEQAAVRADIGEALAAYAEPDGTLLLPGRTLVAVANA
jgi:SAM-dependent methyltransferase